MTTTTTAPEMARIATVNIDTMKRDVSPVGSLMPIGGWHALHDAIVTGRAMGSNAVRTEHEGMIYEAERHTTYVGGVLTGSAVWVLFEGIKPVEDTATVGQRVHITAGVYSGFTGTVVEVTDGGERALVRAEHIEGVNDPVSVPVRWLRVDDLLTLPDPVDMGTPALVREYTASRVADAISRRDRGADAHRRHIAVVAALRSRGVLD